MRVQRLESKLQDFAANVLGRDRGAATVGRTDRRSLF